MNQKPRRREFDPTPLRSLIDTHDQGNVAAAARRIGIAQPSLFRILARTAQPTAQTLDQIANAYGVTKDWAYSGHARHPDDTFGAGVHFAIESMRRELLRIEESITDQPMTPIRPAPASASVNQRPLDTDLPPMSRPTPGVPRAARPGDRATTPAKKGKGKRRA